MKTFEYKGRNRDGQTLEGTIESPSSIEVTRWLMDRGIYPTEILAQKEASETPPWLARITGEDKVKSADLLMFTRQIASMSRSGLPLLQIIDGLRRGTPSKPLAKVLFDVRSSLDRGLRLANALARHPTVFSPFYVNMIRVGEDAGRLDEAFDNLLRQLEFDDGVTKKVKAATRYPTFVLIAIAIAVAVLTIFVIPTFERTFSSMKIELPLLTRIILGVSRFAVNYWWLVLLGGVAAFFAVKSQLKTPAGRLWWDSLSLRLPVMGKITSKSAMARFCESFATAIKSGVPIAQALELSAGVVDNALYEGRILMMRQGLERGESVARLASAAQIFTPLELQMITVGEESGDLEGMLGKLAESYQRDVEYDVSRLGQSIEPLLLGVMAVIVGVLIAGIFMPMWSMSDGLLNTKGR
jgi:MSHA biogenesis protein MshG